MKSLPQLLSPATRDAYTLIEVMAVLVVIGLLSALVLTAGQHSSQKEKMARAKAEMAVLGSALEEFRRNFGDYPRIDQDNSQEGQTAGRSLYAALTGWRGADGSTAIFTARQKAFINGPDYKLLSPWVDADGGDNCLLDPWGHAYRYYYSPGAAWKKAGYVLFSSGQDGAISFPLPIDGLTDSVYAADLLNGRRVNADNLYAGEN